MKRRGEAEDEKEGLERSLSLNESNAEDRLGLTHLSFHTQS